MNAKERFYSGLAKETIGKITSNTDNWTSFLRTMSRNYEFTYPEQVMIYAQRPNATFCKPYEDWNAENYRRYVKRGSTGIALFVMNRDKPYLRYVFDVADTGVRRSSPELKPWEVTPENRSYVMEAMERTFGVAADGVLEAQLEDIASALAAEYWDDYKKQFLDIVANSFLEEYDELNIEVAFKNAVANSVSYTMYCRFVESPDNYFEHEDFQKVFDFNTRQTVNALGTAVNAISTRMFQEIEKAIGEHEQIKATERSTDYERDDLQTGRRLSDSEPSVGERGRETSGQVRQDASSIFGTEQSDAPERHDSDGEPVPAPVGDRGNSESQSGVSDGAVPEGQPRTGQGNAADGVGAAHEQPESTGGGSRDDGAYQQLSLNLFLSENEQISFIDRAESFTPSAFSFAQEEIDHFLLLGSNTDEARKVVALEYMKQKPLEEIVQTLKQVYHGGYGLKEDSGNICAWYAEDGIHLAKGSSAIDSPRAQIVSWETVAERIGELLENGRFATNVELVEASGYERQKLAESLWHLYHDLSEEARSSNYLAILHQEPFRGFPDETADLAEKLDDPRFHATLVQQYSEFRKTLAENPDLLRFHYHKLNLIQKQLYELNMPLREYQTDMMQMPLVRQFITDDEVNADLTRGSGFSGGKARIYNYWQENHSAKEKMDFLKHEYGTGGHSHACSGATHSGQDHDAKGVAYTKSGCDKLQMSWAQVVQRIDGLIRKGRYLSPEEEAERQAIEEAKTDPLEDVYDRFAVIDTEDGEYAIWDNQTDDYYVDPEGVTEYFTDEWLANDYLEEVRQSVAAMESVQPEAPVAEPAEVVEASASEEPKWNYQVGDTVYLDDTAFRVEQITDREVQLRDPTLAYPIFRAENRENFERMLSQDERNHAVRVDAQTEEKPVTEDFLGKTEPRDYTPEYQLLDRLRMDCEYFLGAGQHSEKHLWAGNRHAQIAKMRELYEMIPDKPEWLTPEMINSYEERMAPRYLVAAYHHFENGFDDKLDYYTLEEAEKAAQGYVDGTMEDDGFKYDGAAVYDQQEHKCIRIYGDYPDEKAHAQVRASAEPEQQEPEHFIDHFYVAEDIQKRGALDIKEYSSFDDALRAYYALPDTQRKALGAMNTRDLPGSLDFVQCVDGKDTIIQDYAQVDGWQNAEVMDIIAQLEQSITTREIPPVPAVNFHITDDNIGEGGPKQKFARNIAAIETLFKLESENRNATTEEQEILSNYVGWGGLADAFDPDKGNWAKEYQTLKNLLSEDEYAAARASTLNAHYTSPTVIRSIYDAVGQMGFETGNILEPAMGIGNFFGMLPPEMQSSRLYGVELDSITGRIAQKLYPNAEIKVAGFETTDRRDFYDLAVGNVPFGNYKVSDKPYDKLGFSMAPDAVEVGWQTADDYLSGDVRSKLRVAQMAADRDSSFHINVEALQKAQPKDLDASEIDVRLGATWIMTSKSPVRSCDDVDEQALSYAEIKALCAGNPLIKEKMDLDIDVARLKVLKADHQSQQYRMEDKLLKYFPAEIEKQTGYIHGFEADIKTVEAHPQIADGFCGMEIMGKAYTEKADAGEILLAACKDTKSADPVPLGSYRGFQMELSFDSFRNEFDVTLKGAVSHRVALGTDARGNITRLDNALAGILERLERANEQLNNLYNQQEAAKAEVGKPFPQEAELTAKSQRLAELDAALNMEDSVENRDERSESERPSVLADLKSKAEHIPPAKYSETREEVL